MRALSPPPTLSLSLSLSHMRIAIGYSESSPPPVSMGAAIWFLVWGVWGGRGGTTGEKRPQSKKKPLSGVL